MKSKKNPKADISRNASMYFAIGLALMVFLSYMTINWKVYDKDATDIGFVNMDALDDEDKPKFGVRPTGLPETFRKTADG